MRRTRLAIRQGARLFWVAYGSFTLGAYAEHFSGSKWAWIGLACAVVLLVIGGGSLLRDFWKAEAQ